MPTEYVDPIERFERLYIEREQLLERRGSAPVLLHDILDEGINRAEKRLRELSQNGEVLAHYKSIGQDAVRAEVELEEIAPTLEGLGLNEELDRKRNEIRHQHAIPRVGAARYLMSLLGADIEASEDSHDIPSEPAVVPEVERQLTKLTITIDPNNNIRINTRSLSMGRQLEVAGKKGAEAAGRKLRVDVLRFLAENRGKEFRARHIWEAVRPDEEFSPNTWNLYCTSDFFNNQLTYRRKPIVKVEKVRPRLNHYSVTDFDIEFEHTETAIDIKDESVYMLPNGREVAGKTGRFLNMCERASREKPVTHEEILELYSNEDRMPKNERSILSSLASAARKELKETDLRLIKVKTDKIDPDSHRKYPGYYLERLSDAVSLHEAAVLAAILVFHNEELTKRGYEPMPRDILKALNRKVIETYSNGEKSDAELSELRCTAFTKAMELLEDTERLEDTVKHLEQREDPRYDLLIHLLSYTTEEQRSFIDELLKSSPELVVTFDTGRRQGYQIVGIEKQIRDKTGEPLI